MSSEATPAKLSTGSQARRLSKLRAGRFASWIPVAVLVLLCGVIGAIDPVFFTAGNIVRVLQTAMIPLVLGLGATFVILLGSIDLSVEGVLTLSAVLICFTVLNGANGNDFGLWGVALVFAVGALVGLVNGLIHVWLRIPSFMVTLGMWFVGVGTANALLGGLAVRVNDPIIRGIAINRVLGLPWGVWIAVAALGIAWVIQSYTRLGRHIYALGGGEDLAALSGISVARVRLQTFMLAGVFYALGGVLAVAQLGFGNAQIGHDRLFTTIAAVVVGGTSLSGGEGGVLQTLVGVLIVVVLANGMVLMGIPPSVQQAVQGILIIAAVALSSSRKRARIVK
ncbi:ABC transporter permease [Mesorhizobium sp. XAP10]|uniref:ABC transporter permease n=1 Tax=unclassified Mesorhizobium TaxID=325217 RepID=UPI0023DFB0FB|nr:MULTISPECIES: ABC transporter permease [unclassified Mesorhizobium]MDF3154548.1 ABC transporter permease [Mesorhizobium sp. XAP10]MDF3247902.1 ABC transporter permease [Mesorhizobium sp. XAP4]